MYASDIVRLGDLAMKLGMDIVIFANDFDPSLYTLQITTPDFKKRAFVDAREAAREILRLGLEEEDYYDYDIYSSAETTQA